MLLKRSEFVEKGWGREEIWASNDLYCGKILRFESGKEFSMHFHAKKHETWYVIDGEFEVQWIDTKTAKWHVQGLFPGDVWENEPLFPHKLICFRAGSIMEVSTQDTVEDNYRVMPGDSQK
jgi:mannose-6-phosphate isomerase-like protein (cupin superfamily)